MDIKKILMIFIILSGTILLINIIDFKSFYLTPESIEKNFIVLAVGIDKVEDNFKVTVISEDVSGGSDSDSSSDSKSKSESNIMFAEGKTISEAVVGLNKKLNNTVFFGHMQSLIIGEEIAKKNILEVLDYFVRGYDLRYNFVIHIVKDITAQKLIYYENSTGEFVEKVLPNLVSGENLFDTSTNLKLIDVIKIMDNEYNDLYLPLIKLKEKEEVIKEEGKEEESNKKSYEIELKGFCIFNKRKIIGYLDENQSTAFNLINDRIRFGNITVEDSNGNNVTFDPKNISSKIDVKYEEDKFKVYINLDIRSNVIEIRIKNEVLPISEIQNLEERLNVKYKEYCDSLISYIKENESDILNISGYINKKYPFKWEEIKNNFKEVYKDMEIYCNIENYVVRTYNLVEPVGDKEKGD